MIRHYDLGLRDLRRALESAAAAAHPGTSLVVYFCGHGTEVGGGVGVGVAWGPSMGLLLVEPPPPRPVRLALRVSAAADPTRLKPWCPRGTPSTCCCSLAVGITGARCGVVGSWGAGAECGWHQRQLPGAGGGGGAH